MQAFKMFAWVNVIVGLTYQLAWGAPPNKRKTPDHGGRRTVAGAPGQSGTQEVEKPLRISGQSRNLSMMLVLKNDKDKVRFANVRRSYRDRLPDTRF